MRIKIHYKLTLLFTAIIAVILTVTFFYLNTKLKEHVLNRTKEDLKKQTEISKLIVKKEFLNDIELDAIDKVAKEIGDALNLRATIISSSGIVLGDSELTGEDLEKAENRIMRAEVQQALSKGEGISKRYSSTLGKDLLYHALLIEAGHEKALIRLSIPLSEVELITGKLKKILIFSFGVAFLLAFWVSLIFSLFITRPIKEISKVAREAARGNLNRKVLLNSSDEIGDLAEAFNFMLEQIKLKINEVAASESRLRAVLLSMFSGVIVTDREGNIILANDTLKNALDIKQNPEGKRSIEVIRNIQIQEVIDIVLKEKKGIISKELVVSGAQEKMFLLHAAAVLRESICDGAVLVFHDITELRKLENIRKDFVANVSHELRTPVTNILGYTETLLSGAWKDKKNLEEFLKIINSDAQRLGNLIEDILDLSKIESARENLNLEYISLNDLIKETHMLLDKKASTKKIKVHLKLDINLPKIYADKKQIQKALINLTDNAIKYNRDSGRITISTKRQDNQVRVDISDNGFGIPEEDLERIFERFYRVDKGRSRSLGGTGLGLSIVKNVILRHNGRIWCESTEGQGSVFTFTLPIST